MPDISIRIQGIDALQRKLGRLRANDILEPPMEASLLKIEQVLKVYPAKRPGSTYVWTGTLGRGWSVAPIERTANGLIGRVGTKVEYAPFVQGHVLQSRIHRGRWQTDAMVVERLRPWIVNRFRRAIDRAIERG